MEDRLADLLKELSPDTLASALSAATERGFDLTPGPTPLDESLQTLGRTRDSLADALKRGTFARLPRAVQKSIASAAEAASNGLKALHEGQDQVAPIINDVDNLYQLLWGSRLEEMAPELPGYEQKMRRLEEVLARSEEVNATAASAADRHQEIASLVDTANARLEALRSSIDDITNRLGEARQAASAAAEAQAQSSATLESIKELKALSESELATTRQSKSNVSELEVGIRAFSEHVAATRTQLDQALADAGAGLAKNSEETLALVEQLRALEAQIKDQLELATGKSLFYAFDVRRAYLARGKWVWFSALVFFILATCVLAYNIAVTTRSLDGLFFFKISLVIPASLIGAFCVAQYRRERGLEEAYAFKSTLSLSLTPYQDLVSNIVNMQNAEEKQRFTEFLLTSISNIFASPSDRSPDLSEETLSPLIKRLREVMSALEPLLKALRLS